MFVCIDKGALSILKTRGLHRSGLVWPCGRYIHENGIIGDILGIIPLD